MSDAEPIGLIRNLAFRTKALILESEARAGVWTCAQLAQLMDLLAGDADERLALAIEVLRALTASLTPAGRIRDLRTAFGISELELSGGAGPAPAAGAASPDLEETATIPTVLVADDDAHLRKLLRVKLEEEGFQVIEAADGQEAWRLLQTIPLQALVLDLKMPGLHGLEILGRLMEMNSKLPVVVCTAYERAEDEFAVISYPTLRFLTKPVEPGHLAETVINLLAESA